MKLLFLSFLLTLSACASLKTYEREWQVDAQDQAASAKFKEQYEACREFAYQSKVKGSPYGEGDIAISCLERKGYKYSWVEVK